MATSASGPPRAKAPPRCPRASGLSSHKKSYTMMCMLQGRQNTRDMLSQTRPRPQSAPPRVRKFRAGRLAASAWQPAHCPHRCSCRLGSLALQTLGYQASQYDLHPMKCLEGRRKTCVHLARQQTCRSDCAGTSASWRDRSSTIRTKAGRHRHAQVFRKFISDLVPAAGYISRMDRHKSVVPRMAWVV